jgi:hypothetical protein
MDTPSVRRARRRFALAVSGSVVGTPTELPTAFESPPEPADDVAVNESEGRQHLQGTSAVTPELALVDPQLAARARASLSEPTDTLSYLSSLITTRSAVTLAAVATERTVVPTTSPRQRRRPSRSLTASAAFAVTVLAILLFDVHVEFGGSSEAAAPPKIAQKAIAVHPPKPKPSTKQPSRQSPQTPAVGLARRFAWAPVEGASGYRFELFRASSRVFAGETSRPELTLPATWNAAGAQRRLEPGEYRWYVWPLVAGSRSGVAIVQAKLVVPAR